jgi:hypothetical protein
MLALFDTDMGIRQLTFHVREWVHTHGACYFQVIVLSVERANVAATGWVIDGLVESPLDYAGKKSRVCIAYASDKREGTMTFEEKADEPQGAESKGELDDAKKADALMIVIHKIIARYQNSHAGNLDEAIFVLFNEAKAVHGEQRLTAKVRAGSIMEIICKMIHRYRERHSVRDEEIFVLFEKAKRIDFATNAKILEEAIKSI